MYNAETPLRAELPSSRQLLRSTILAAMSAILILVTIVLPAEYGVDPTGAGRLLGMTEMGEIKRQLAAEAAADSEATTNPAVPDSASTVSKSGADSVTPAISTETQSAVAKTEAQPGWRDELRFTLTPGEGKEIKLRMAEGAKAEFEWVVDGGAVNYDTHGDGSGRSISYEKGRGVPADDGVLVAAFTGNHGWYWRNRGLADVKVVLRTRGQYTDIKQVQ